MSDDLDFRIVIDKTIKRKWEFYKDFYRKIGMNRLSFYAEILDDFIKKTYGEYKHTRSWVNAYKRHEIRGEEPYYGYASHCTPCSLNGWESNTLKACKRCKLGDALGKCVGDVGHDSIFTKFERAYNEWKFPASYPDAEEHVLAVE